jgi:TonB family protein
VKWTLSLLIVLCLVVVTAASQSLEVQDDREDHKPVAIAPTDWESLNRIELIADDCDFADESESCPSSGTKPRTTAKDRSMGVPGEPEHIAKVLAAYTPCYPGVARMANISGRVAVLVVVDEGGFVIWARASGNPIFRPAARNAACKWRFEPASSDIGFQKVNRLITFYFVVAG